MFQSIWKKRIDEQKQQIKVSEKLIEDQHQTINKIDIEEDDDMIGQEISNENTESKVVPENQEIDFKSFEMMKPPEVVRTF